MKTLKKKPKPTTADAQTKPKAKVKKVKPASDTVYSVKLYAQSLIKLTDKQGTRVFGASNGLLIYGHKKPRSPKVQKKTIALERVVQFGGNEESGWVYLIGRTLIDSFQCVGEPTRSGKLITFDLGDGVKTAVNADMHGIELEVVSEAD